MHCLQRRIVRRFAKVGLLLCTKLLVVVVNETGRSAAVGRGAVGGKEALTCKL